MNNPEYEQNEARLLAAQIREVELAPLADRRDARNGWHEAIKTFPDLVAERVSWIINGSYGYGACIAAKRIVDSPRMNQADALSQLVAALEWNCPSAFAREAFLSLSNAEQKRINDAIKAEIETTECAIA